MKESEGMTMPEELKKEEKVARTRTIKGNVVTKTHVTKSNLMGWKVPMTWEIDFEGATPQQVLALAAEQAVIKARVKYGVKGLSEVEAREKYTTFKVVVKDLDVPAERAPQAKLSDNDKRVLKAAQVHMAAGKKFVEAYRLALEEIELEDMEQGEAQ